MGRVKQTSLFTEVKKNCDMEMDVHGMMDDCCDNEMTLEIIEDSQQLVQIEKAPQADYFLLYATALILTADLQATLKKDVEFNDSGPPDLSEPERYILFQNLKIPAALQS